MQRWFVDDEETGLYYLRSRYYNPNLSRFVNADSVFDLNSGLFRFSQFTYCANSPVFWTDSDGQGIILACVLIFGGLGMIIGGCVAADESKRTLGYVDGWWVIGGMLIGGAAGALIGFTVGTVAKAIGVTLTAGSGGILGDKVYSSWQDAEKALRAALNSVTDAKDRVFYTEWGTRIADAYNATTGVIAEAKYGYQGLSTFIQTEISKDLYLLQNGIVSSVEWHFYVSQVSNSGGPSAPLLEALVDAGFKIIFH